MSDLQNDPEYVEWERRIRDELIPKIEGSSFSVTLVPEGTTDIKFAVELGLSIMLGKPIVAVIQPGTKVPDGLVRVADHLVEVDLRGDVEAGRKRLLGVIEGVLASLPDKPE